DIEGHDNLQASRELQTRHLEWLALDGALDKAAADCFHAHAHVLHLAVDLHFDPLKIRFEATLGLAGDLAAHTAQSLRLAARRVFAAGHRLFASDGPLHSHFPPQESLVRVVSG